MTLQHQAEADAEPVVVEYGDGAGDLVIVCEHASNAMPARFAGLGLTGEALNSHIAWDPGALEVARHLAERFDAPLVRATMSRLIIDCNRPLDAPDLIVSESDSIAVPGNRIDDDERDRRYAAVHEPFHAVLGRLIADRRAAGQLTALVSVHSFTPILHGRPRPWDVGIIFGGDRRLADPLSSGLREDGSLVVGINEPYSPADRVFYTHERHAEPLNLPSVMIEIRNDLIKDQASQGAMAERLARLLDEAIVMLADMTEKTPRANIAK
ncbi:MAG TPA: N-formylglutamate amidohydrolase [Afifellaceae bacterium]|nr:N-formylglutamate amidohydrolase [Afifellaceae bacterium]